MRSYGLVQSFDIDNGGLTGQTLQGAFTLGVEWGIAWEKANSAGSTTMSLHAENCDRIASMLAAQGRRFNVGPASSGWVEISIAGLD